MRCVVQNGYLLLPSAAIIHHSKLVVTVWILQPRAQVALHKDTNNKPYFTQDTNQRN